MTQEIITITVEAGQMTARRKYRKIAQRRPVPVWATDIHTGSGESRRTDFQTDGIYQRKPGTCADHRKGDGGAVGIQGRGPDCKVGLS